MVATKAPPASAKAPKPKRSFRAAVQPHVEQFTPSVSLTPQAATAQKFDVDIPAYGFLRGIYAQVVVTGGAGGGATYEADAPFTWIQAIQFLDAGSANIIFQITGYELYLINKWGGYTNGSDAKEAPGYTQGGANGNSVFTLRIPIEIVPRDCLGALPNTNNAVAFKISGYVAGYNDVYVANPVTPPTNISIKWYLDAWWPPEKTDLAGNDLQTVPPAVNTVQYWSKQSKTLSAAGAFQFASTRVGNNIREIIFVNRDAAGARTDASWPQVSTVIYEGQNMSLLDKDLWRHKMYEAFGFTGTLDAAGAMDTGVYVLPFNDDFTHKPGNELRDGYLQTAPGTRLELQGTTTAANNITWMTNDVQPPKGAAVTA